MTRAHGPSAAPFLATLALVAGCATAQPRYLTSPTRLSVAVIGVRPAVNDARLRDLRIGFGLTSLVTEELYDSGRFRLTEIAPEVRRRIDRMTVDAWQRAALPDERDLDHVAVEAGADLVAFGEVVRFESPRSSLTLGPFSTQTNRLDVAVRICIRDAALAATWCEEGSGSASSSATAAAFEFRGDRVVFDQTSVGNAIAEAVDAAMKALMRPR